jgi:hypothetical protein
MIATIRETGAFRRAVMLLRTLRADGLLTVALVGGLIGNLRAEESPPEPQLERLKAHVETLASPEFAGRRGAGARKAEAYITAHLRELGLEPLFDGQFTQDIPGRDPGEIVGRNVGARLGGTDPDLSNEWVILSAHYDHLGVRDGQLYPGADDNASAVAMLLEAARCFTEAAGKPRRGILFIAFDLEENGLWGSRHFVEHPPVPLEQVKLFLTADLIGGALGGVCKQEAFVMGTEHATGLRPWVEQSAAGLPLKLAVVGSDILLIDRSDYGPFRARQIPYLFFSTGENPRYHTPRDTPESLDYPKLEAISRLMARVVRHAALAETLPAWCASSEPTLGEVQVVRDVFQTLLDHRDELKLTDGQAARMTSTIEQLDAILQRGSVTPSERRWMLRMAQFVLFTVL